LLVCLEAPPPKGKTEHHHNGFMPEPACTSKKTMPDVKRTRRGRPGPKAQRSALLVTKGKKSGRDATVEPKRSAGVGPVMPFSSQGRPLESQLEEGDSVEAFLERATLRELEYDQEEALLVSSTGVVVNAVKAPPRDDGAAASLAAAESSSSLELESSSPFASLPVPRRPAWDETTTPEELRAREEASFLAWRRGVADAEEGERARRERRAREAFLPPSATVATPFERNIEVWRQLWRTLERSDCVFLIVDARWPSFYANDDLVDYVASIGKPLVIVVNKADYLSRRQRRRWLGYWKKKADKVAGCAFFSARTEQKRLDDEAKRRAAEEEERAAAGDASSSSALPKPGERHESDFLSFLSHHQDDDDDLEGSDLEGSDSEDFAAGHHRASSSRCLRPEELLSLGYRVGLGDDDAQKKSLVTIGMVGYPNVGKSSCVNALRGATRHGVGARAAVSATPGKTKHLQTLRVGEATELCDCPGLVFPALVANGAAELVCSGVVPLARARDPIGAAELVLRRVPAALFDATYGTDLATKVTGDAVTALDLLDAFCETRDYKTAGSGQPDRRRAARDIVRDYVDGTLLCCHPPPDDKDAARFHLETRRTVLAKSHKLRAKLANARTGDAFLTAAHAAGFRTNSANKTNWGSDNIVAGPEEEHATATTLLREATTTHSQKKQPPHQPTKRGNRWGKKGRRFRDVDPYTSRTQDGLLDVPL